MTDQLDEPVTLSETIARIRATVPVTSVPEWAILERALFELLDGSWRVFETAFCRPDGSLRYAHQLSTRDGGDDFFETFFNWPQYYLLGGDAAILQASERHWKAVSAQLTDLGIYKDDFEVGYDWFHQGESLLFSYFLAAAEPDVWRERAARFADLYVDPARGNYDERLNIVKAAHNGSGGARAGLSDTENYPWLAGEAERYGFPLDWMPGAPAPHRDLAPDPRLGIEMQTRLGKGDVVGNISISGLVLNAYILTGDEKYAAWIERYVGGWRQRAADNGGLVPDNVGIDGTVGSQLDGRWYGGHYGWTWPHGIYSLGQATAVGAIAAATVSGDETFLDLPRAQYDAVIAEGRTGDYRQSDTSVRSWWESHLGSQIENPVFLVPYRRSDKGWFDWNPVQISVPVSLWHFSADPADRERLRRLRAVSGFDWSAVLPNREKEEGGHEDAWFTYLEGDNPRYPELILAAAQYQVRRRLALIQEHAGEDVAEADIHIWQLVQPIVTEALLQLTVGGPQVIYNGGQLQARVRWFDLDCRRAGLPQDVAALVSSIDPAATVIELVNLSPSETRALVLQGGAFAEHEIVSVEFDSFDSDWAGSFYDFVGSDVRPETQSMEVGGRYLRIDLAPNTRIRLTVALRMRAHHQTYSAPWDTVEGVSLG